MERLAPYLNAIFPAFLISIAAVVAAVLFDIRDLSFWATGGFAVVMVSAAERINRSLRDDAATTPQLASRINARLMALTFAWGGSTIAAAYLLTGLYWFHAWQYAMLMALIGALLYGYDYQIRQPNHVFRTAKALDVMAGLTGAQMFAAGVGVWFLIDTGKLETKKGDWAANHVFLAGGLAIICLSALALYTYFHVRRNTAAVQR